MKILHTVPHRNCLSGSDGLIGQELVAREIAKAQLRSMVVILAASVFASPALSADPNSQTVQAYKLTQSHFTLGPLEAFYTDDAVKIVLKRNGAAILARAPSWKVVLFRPSGRIAHEITRKDFLATGLKWVQISGIPASDLHRKSEQLVHGEKVIEFTFSTNRGSSNYRYWVIEPVKVSNQGCEILQRAFRVPFRHAIPLKLTGDEPGHDDLTPQSKVAWSLTVNARRPGGRTPMWRLETIEWSKVRLPKSEFDYPVGYKIVKTEPEVLITSPTREVFEDLFGTVTPTKTTSHQSGKN
jgi:hypothetical protein